MQEKGTSQTDKPPPWDPASESVRLDVHHLVNYTFAAKEPQPEKDSTGVASLQRLKAKYERLGMLRSVEAVMIVHQYNHAHVLLLQCGAVFQLPGGRCRPEETEMTCLKRKLSKKLSPPEQYEQPSWEVGPLLATYCRPYFDHAMYPYPPPHVTKPKEYRQIFLVPLPEKRIFAVPRNLQLIAVPLFDHVKGYNFLW